MSRDSYPEILADIARRHIVGDTIGAALLIATISSPPSVPRKRPSPPSIGVTAAVFTRDRYQCRYCGEKVILQNVLRLLARLYPEQFPWDPTRQITGSHYAFTSRAATIDHIDPTARDGDRADPTNLATACWLCNNRKTNLSVQEAGWALVDPTDPGWQGLSDVYEPLWTAAGRPELSAADRRWMGFIRKLA